MGLIVFVQPFEIGHLARGRAADAGWHPRHIRVLNQHISPARVKLFIRMDEYLFLDAKRERYWSGVPRQYGSRLLCKTRPGPEGEDQKKEDYSIHSMIQFNWAKKMVWSLFRPWVRQSNAIRKVGESAARRSKVGHYRHIPSQAKKGFYSSRIIGDDGILKRAGKLILPYRNLASIDKDPLLLDRPGGDIADHNLPRVVETMDIAGDLRRLDVEDRPQRFGIRLHQGQEIIAGLRQGILFDQDAVFHFERLRIGGDLNQREFVDHVLCQLGRGRR